MAHLSFDAQAVTADQLQRRFERDGADVIRTLLADGALRLHAPGHPSVIVNRDGSHHTEDIDSQ